MEIKALWREMPDLLWPVAVLLVVAIFICFCLSGINHWYYQLLRGIYQEHQAKHLADFAQQESEHFRFHYRNLAAESLLLIEEESEKIFHAVNDFFDFSPAGKIPVVIYPTSGELNASFGWEGDRSPMGVYFMGYIHVLAPEAWIDGSDAVREQVFCRLGPMAHEYSHLIIDEVTAGNYPRWFSEGVAQYVERQLGYFTTETPPNPKGEWYDFARLERSFDSQSDQSLAYWQSLRAVAYLSEHYGEKIIGQILTRLADGQTFVHSLRELTGHDYQSLTAALI